MRRSRALPVATLAFLLAVLALAAPLFATTIVVLSDDDLVDRAQRIVHGDVVSKRAAALPDGRIYTEYVFRPRELLKGAAEADGTVVFREWGGELGNVRYVIPGAGEFAAGEEVVAFLGEADPRFGVGFTVGLSLGKFRVTREPGAPPRVRRALARGADLVDPATGRRVEPTDEGPGRDLDAFKAAIRARVGAK